MEYLSAKSDFFLSLQFSLGNCSHQCCLEYSRSFSKDVQKIQIYACIFYICTMQREIFLHEDLK